MFQSLLNSLASTNSLFQGLFTAQGSTNSGFQALHTAQAATNTAFESRIQEGETAYSWGDHATSGYLTAFGNILPSLAVADRSQLGANLSGLTQGTYTGSLTSVSYTSAVSLVIGRIYDYGFSFVGNGTGTLSIAGNSLVKTTVGAISNHFTYHSGESSNMIITLAGTGLAIGNAQAIYCKEITNGALSVVDLNVGTLAVVGKTVMYSGDAGTGTNLSDYNNDLPGLTTNLSAMNNDIGFITTIASSDLWNKAATDATTATNETAVLRQATNALQIAINNIGGVMYRYFADAQSNVLVLATITNISSSLTGTTHTFVVPAGGMIFSADIKWNGLSLGNSFDLVIAEDLMNTTAAAQSLPGFNVARSDNGAPITSAQCRPDPSSFNTYHIVGLQPINYNLCSFGFR